MIDLKSPSPTRGELSYGNPERGTRLPEHLRRRLEAAAGICLGHVRIHQGALAERFGANAIAHGTDIHFAKDRYNPENSSGYRLLAHEVAHVAQQLRGQVRRPGGRAAAPVALVVDDALEDEADQLAAGRRAARTGGCVENIDWSVLLPNLYIEVGGNAPEKLTDTSGTMRRIGAAIHGTPLYFPFQSNRDTIHDILKSWVNSSRNTIKRFIFFQKENVRHYMSWENMARALIGEAKSLGNLAREDRLAQRTIVNGYINRYLCKYLSFYVTRTFAKNAYRNDADVQRALSTRRPYKGEYSHWYPNMGKVIADPYKYEFKHRVAVIHDLNRIFRGLEDKFWQVPDNKTEMTYLVPNGDGTYQQRQQRQNGTGGFRRGQPPRGMGNNQACTLLEDGEVVAAARASNMPIELGPSFTTGRMLQAAYAQNAGKNTMTAISWGIFAFWNAIYSKKFSRVHRFHGVMDMAKNYGVDYTPFTYPAGPPTAG